MNLFILRTANVDQKSQIYDIMFARAMSSAKLYFDRAKPVNEEKHRFSEWALRIC